MKIAIIVAVILLAVGLAVTIVGLCIADFKFTSEPRTDTVELNEDFDRISVDVDTTDVKFVVSGTGKSFVEIVEHGNSKLGHNVQIKNGVLSISEKDDRAWYEHVGIGWGERSVTVYLAKTDFESINIETDTGAVTMPAGLSFKNASVELDTGDVTWSAHVWKTLEVDTDTGKISVSGITCENLEIESDTGKVNTEGTRVMQNMSVEVTTGKVTLKNTVAGGMLNIKTSTGDVDLDSCDGGTVNIKTSTGDVSGTLLTDKDFDADSGTGKVTTPPPLRGSGACKIHCSTGDINVSVKQ